jgi:hypothetical protein
LVYFRESMDETVSVYRDPNCCVSISIVDDC